MRFDEQARRGVRESVWEFAVYALTQRDRMLVQLLDAAGGIDGQSLARVLGTSPVVAHRRMRALRAAGLVHAYSPFHGAPSLYLPTRAGTLDATGRDGLEPPSVSPSSYPHQLAVGRVAAELARSGLRWESERTLRRAERDAQAEGDPGGAHRWSLRIASFDAVGRAGRNFHLPDLAIWPGEDAEPIAIEVELTEKAPGRLRAILSGYALHLEWGRVAYLCGGDHAARVERAVRRAAADQPGAADLLRTVELDAFDGDWLAALVDGAPAPPQGGGPEDADGLLRLSV